MKKDEKKKSLEQLIEEMYNEKDEKDTRIYGNKNIYVKKK